MVKELAIRNSGLYEQFDKHIAVNKVDLEIGGGEYGALIEANGAGKTLPIEMLAALVE